MQCQIELAIQLARLDNGQSRQKFLQFLLHNREAVRTLSLHYYTVQRQSDLFARVVRRWKGTGASDPFQFEALAALAPITLSLPIPVISANVMRMLAPFLKAVGDDTRAGTTTQTRAFNEGRLARSLRILQWDLFTRDLVNESANSKNRDALELLSMTERARLTGLPSEEFLNAFVSESWRVHYAYHPIETGTGPLVRHSQLAAAETRAHSLADAAASNRRAFDLLLTRVSHFYPEAHRDLTRMLSTDDPLAPIEALGIDGAVPHVATGPTLDDRRLPISVVEDGEITFFTLLWFLRAAFGRCRGGHLDSSAIARAQPPIRFVDTTRLPAPVLKTDTDLALGWSQDALTVDDFLEALGLATRGPSSRHLLTRRWRSLIRWLHRTKGKASRILKNDTDKEYEDLKKAVIAGFSGSVLDEFLTNDELLGDEVGTVALLEALSAFAAAFAGAIGSGCSCGKDAAGSDAALVRVCRLGFLPLEYFFRSFQPHEMNLVILGLDHQKEPMNPDRLEPISLGFATVIGELPLESEPDATERTADDLGGTSMPSPFLQWFAPYWTFFSSVATLLSGARIRADEAAAAVYRVLDIFSHEVKKTGRFLLSDSVVKRLATVIDLDEQKFRPDWTAANDSELPSLRPWMESWRICPVPEVWEDMRHLWYFWTSKNALKDFGIDGVVLGSVLPAIGAATLQMFWSRTVLEDRESIHAFADARWMAVARDAAIRVKNINERSTYFTITMPPLGKSPARVFTASVVFDERAHGLRFRSLADDHEGVALQTRNAFVRMFVALIANAAEHAFDATLFNVEVSASDTALTIVVRNEAVPGTGRQASGSSFGTTGVLSAMLATLHGSKNSTKPNAGQTQWIDELRIPFARRVGERPWLIAEGVPC